MSQVSPLEKVMERWRWNCGSFFREALGFTPSNHQESGCAAVDALVRAKFKVGRWKSLTEDERKLESAVRKFKPTVAEVELADRRGISIASGHNTGKDRWLAALLIWWEFCWPTGTKCLVTGPNMSTIRSVLWHEFRKQIRDSKFMGQQPGWLVPFFEIQQDKLIKRDTGLLSFVEARTANVEGSADAQGEALAGRHEKYMILAVDEASGVPDGVFKPIEGAMAGRVNFAVLIGNMTRNMGYFYDTHFKHKEFWVTQRWDSEESNLDSISGGATDIAGLVSFYERKYGRDSNAFRVRIKGLPPSTDADAFIPREWILRAIGRDLKCGEMTPMSFGVDVAYSGVDTSAIVRRQGPKVFEPLEFHGVDNMALVGWVVREFAQHKPEHIFVDTIGIGHGVWSRLREMNYPVHAVVVSEKANEDRLGNKRNELWNKLRDAFESGSISLPECKCSELGSDKRHGMCVCCQLVEEISAQRCHPPDSSGVIRVWSKAEMKSKGFESPNLADALCLTYAINVDYAPEMQYDFDVDKLQYVPVDSVTGY